MKLKVKYLSPDIAPLCSKFDDSGYDLRAYLKESVIIPPKSIATIPTGICLELVDYPKNEFTSAELQIRPRSGLTKEGIIAQLGTVDVSYRGEIKVNLMNFSNENYEVKSGYRIAQIVICPVYKPLIESVTELSDTERGEKGFGSSGKN